MATSYTIDFTDKNITRSFQLAPYTTNGPADPTSGSLDGKASSAATSLLLYGKGSPDYGERLQENMVHLLENLAGDVEPTYPIGGQLWFDKSTNPYVLRIYNTKKHKIIANLSNPGDADYITIEGDHTSRLIDGFRVRIVNEDVDSAQEDYILGPVSVDSNGNTTMQLIPHPSGGGTRVGWYLGGWEYLIQNNVGLFEELNANNQTITGLSNPINNQDAATKIYVDNAIASSNELNELTDVNLITPLVDNELLVYDFATSTWTNKNAVAANLLTLSGGIMSGIIDMGNNWIQNLLDPSSAQDAATKGYVDTEILNALSGSVSNLEDLNDVIYSGIQNTYDILQYNGAVWTNVDKTTMQSNLDILPTTGGSMTGSLILSGNPVLTLEAATKSYVDLEIANAISASGDGVVDGGFFDAFGQELTLTRTNGLPNVVIGGFAAGGAPSTGIIHQINDPITNYPSNQKELYMEAVFGSDSTYPEITLDTFLKNVNQHLGDLSARRQRVVLVADGTPGVRFGDQSTYGDLPFVYVNGYNTLSVFVNGVKQMISEPGWLLVEANVVGDPTNIIPVWHGFKSGLSTGLTYYFRVDVNLGAANGSNIPTITVPVPGAQAQSLGQVLDMINAFVDTTPTDDPINSVYTDFNGLVPTPQPPFGVIMEEGSFQFFSGYPGTGSKINITDGDGLGGPGLFANMTGGGLHLFAFDNVDTPDSVRNDGQLRVPSNILNPPAPITWAINEYGRPGRASEYFYFTDVASTPPAGAVMEISIEPVLVYNRESQEL